MNVLTIDSVRTLAGLASCSMRVIDQVEYGMVSTVFHTASDLGSREAARVTRLISAAIR